MHDDRNVSAQKPLNFPWDVRCHSDEENFDKRDVCQD
jgi:hypothetical protein